VKFPGFPPLTLAIDIKDVFYRGLLSGFKNLIRVSAH